MKILLAAPTFGVYGGIEVFVMTLADWLRKNTPHEIRVCFKVVRDCEVTPTLRSECTRLGLEPHFVHRASVGLVSSIFWADLVHSNTCSPDIALLSKLTGRPLVLTVHNWFRGKRGAHNRLWHLCSRLADWRTYNSEFVRSSWESAGRLHASDLIPTVSIFPHREVPQAQRQGFFFIGRLIQNKGVDVLLQAYERARIDKRRWPLTIAGEGPMGEWARSYVAKHDVAGVQIVGFLSEEEKARRMAAAMWLVAPPNTKEDMGLTPIEARSVSVPAIVTRDGGLPEAAGPAALLCTPGNVEELAGLLEHAASMPAKEYGERATLAKESLRTYLRPMSDYVAIYDRVTAARGLLHSGAT